MATTSSKELEDRFGGWYTPSPGDGVPELTMLEDLGFARTTPDEGGRKNYEITELGQRSSRSTSQRWMRPSPRSPTSAGRS